MSLLRLRRGTSFRLCSLLLIALAQRNAQKALAESLLMKRAESKVSLKDMQSQKKEISQKDSHRTEESYKDSHKGNEFHKEVESHKNNESHKE